MTIKDFIYTGFEHLYRLYIRANFPDFVKKLLIL